MVFKLVEGAQKSWGSQGRLHSERNVRFEMDRAWAKLRPGGAIIVDDVDVNWGFHSFNESFPGHFCLVCDAEPISPDHRRFNERDCLGS
jgi:hypothetical protein